MHRFAKVLIGASVALSIAGCATPARIDQMTAKVSSTTAQPSFLKSSISVGTIAGGKETNPLWVSNVSSPDFSHALEDSLRLAGLLATSKDNSRYLLSAHLNALEQPLFGFDMTVTATVSYVLADKATGNEIDKATIATPFTATVSDAFLGVERLKLANEGAIKENLTKVVERLYSLKPGTVFIESPLPNSAQQKSKEVQLQEAKDMFDKGLISREIYIERQKNILDSH